ncbi:hypothetical protein EBZ39_18925 [bacterium]|nr:hypothetical protein [bacterium]
MQEERSSRKRRGETRRDIRESLREQKPNPTLFVCRPCFFLQPVGADKNEGEAPAGEGEEEKRDQAMLQALLELQILEVEAVEAEAMALLGEREVPVS